MAVGAGVRSERGRAGSARGALVLALVLASCNDGLLPEDWDPGASGEETRFAIEYGMNMSSNGWSDRGIFFADAMQRAHAFARYRTGEIRHDEVPLIPVGETPPLVGEGWPDFQAFPAGWLPMARLFNGMGGSIPEGTVAAPYVVTWVGTGSCRLEGPFVAGERNRTSHRVEVLIDPAAGGGDGVLQWVLEWSDPADPVRDAHVWLPGMEATQPILWPPFVEKLQAMNLGRGPHTVRTLDWCRANTYGITTGPGGFVFDLAGRATPRSPSQGTRRGVCPEYQVAVCNAVGANLHYTMPHRTEDMSVADYAVFVRDTLIRIRDGSPAVPGTNGGQRFEGLRRDRHLTLEFSNEIWNSGFPVYHWLNQEAAANGRTYFEEIAHQIQFVFDIADDVFWGPDAPRLHRYVGAQMIDASFLAGVLAALPSDYRIDAIGCAAYFRPTNSVINGWLAGADTVSGACPNCPTATEVIEAARMSIPLQVRAGVRANRVLVQAWTNPDGYHPAFELYEGGQGITAGFQPWGAAASQAQLLPAMYHAYVDDYVPMLVEEGVDLVNWFNFMSAQDLQGGGGLGPFGHWASMDQTITLPVPAHYVDQGAPKAAAVYRGPPRLP